MVKQKGSLTINSRTQNLIIEYEKKNLEKLRTMQEKTNVENPKVIYL